MRIFNHLSYLALSKKWNHAANESMLNRFLFRPSFSTLFSASILSLSSYFSFRKQKKKPQAIVGEYKSSSFQAKANKLWWSVVETNKS